MEKKERVIFYAEDDLDDRFFFGKALAQLKLKQKYSLEFAEDGQQLLNLLDNADRAKRLPDIIFLDLNLPGKNGVECLSEIRGRERYDLVPVIVITTSRAQRDVQLTFDLGANLYLCKPGDFDRLAEMLQICLDRSAGTRTMGATEEYLIDAGL